MHSGTAIAVGASVATALEMARQHQAALDQLEELLSGANRPTMDDAAAAVIMLGAQFQLLVQELEKLT